MRRAWLILAIASASTFLFVLDAGFLSVAFPSIEEDFATTSRATLSWVSIGYFVSGSPSILIGASLGDRFGRSRIFGIGLLLFALGAIALALAPVVGLLIAARAVQGVGAGLLASMSLAIVLPEFPPEQRGLAIGAWGAAGAFAALLAPTGGAALVESVGWRATLAVSAPVALLAAVVGWRVLPNTAVAERSRLDPLGMASAAVALAAAATLVSLGNEWGWLSSGAITLAVTIVVSASVFAIAAKRRPGAVLDRSLLGERDFVVGASAASLQQLGFLSMFFSTPLILVNIWDWSVLEAGLGMSLSMAVSMTVAPIGGRLADRSGHRRLIMIGAALFAGGMIWWRAFIGLEPTVTHFVIGAVMVGAGGALCGNLTTSAALKAIDRDRMAVASAALGTMRRVFAGIGVAIAVALLGEADGAALLAGAHRVWMFVAAVTLAMIPASMFLERE